MFCTIPEQFNKIKTVPIDCEFLKIKHTYKTYTQEEMQALIDLKNLKFGIVERADGLCYSVPRLKFIMLYAMLRDNKVSILDCFNLTEQQLYSKYNGIDFSNVSEIVINNDVGKIKLDFPRYIQYVYVFNYKIKFQDFINIILRYEKYQCKTLTECIIRKENCNE